MWGVIRVAGEGNVKEACEALAWDMEDSGLQVRWKDHQSAESSAQILIINVPNVFDKGGIESEIVWHLMEIEKSLLKKGIYQRNMRGCLSRRSSSHGGKTSKGRGEASRRRICP